MDDNVEPNAITWRFGAGRGVMANWVVFARAVTGELVAINLDQVKVTETDPTVPGALLLDGQRVSGELQQLLLLLQPVFYPGVGLRAADATELNLEQ